MPVRVVTGFEIGTTAGWLTGNTGNKFADLSNGTPALTTTAPRTGTYCLEVATTAASENIGWDTNTLGASQNRLAVGFAVRFPTTVPTIQILAQDQVAAGLAMIVFVDSSDRVCVGFEGGNTQTGPTLSPDTWYYIEVYHNLSANPHTIQWSVNTAAQTQVSQNQAATTLTEFRLGTTNSETYTARYDDVVVYTDTANITFPLGLHKVQPLTVDPAGTWTLSGTAANWNTFTNNGTLDTSFTVTEARDRADEWPPTIGASADGVAQVTIAASDFLSSPMTSYTLAGGESVTGLRALVAGWATSTTATNIRFDAYNGTTAETFFALGDPNFDNSTTVPAWVCKMLTTANYDTQAELNALELRGGWGTDANPDCGWHGWAVEVAVKDGNATATPAVIAAVATVPAPSIVLDPIGKAGVVGWWKDTTAADASTTTSWADVSGRGNTAVNASSVVTHETVEVNGLPVERFSAAANSYLWDSTATGITNTWTLAFVHRPAVSSFGAVCHFAALDDEGPLVAGASGKLNVGSIFVADVATTTSTLSAGTVYRHVITCDASGNVAIYTDGAADTTTAGPGTFFYGGTLGIQFGAQTTSHGTPRYNGDLGEVVLYNSVVDSTERAALFTYLSRWTAAPGGVTATPAVVAATAALPRPGGTVTAGPAVAPVTATIPQPAAGVAVTATPAVAVGSVAVAQPAVNVGAVPGVVPTVAALARPAGNVAAGPTIVATVAAVPSPSRDVGAGPSVLAGAAALTRPDVNVAAGPLVVPAVAALGQATPTSSTNATPTPAVVPGVAALTRPDVNVVAGPLVVPAVAALGQAVAVAGGGATATPAIVAAIAALVRPSVNITVPPAVISIMADVGMGVGSDVVNTPAVVPLIGAVPLPTVIAGGNVTKTPAVLAAVVALAQPTPLTGSTVTPAVLAAITAIGGVGVGVGASPAVLAALAGLPRPSVNVAAGPLVVPVVVALPQAAAIAGGGATAQPLAVVAVAALTRPNVNVVAGPGALATAAALSRPLVAVAAGPATLLSIVAVPQATPQVGASGNPTPAVVAAVAALAQPNVNVRAGPLVLTALVAVGQVAAGQSTTKTPATILSVAALPAVAVRTSAGPTVIAALVVFPLVADVGGEPNPGGGLVTVGTPGGGLIVAAVGGGLIVLVPAGGLTVGNPGGTVTVPPSNGSVQSG